MTKHRHSHDFRTRIGVAAGILSLVLLFTLGPRVLAMWLQFWT